MMNRRDFLRRAGAVSVAACVPTTLRETLAASAEAGGLIIEEVDVLRVSGMVETLAGVNRQHQVQPLHLYDERRPKPYRDDSSPKTVTNRSTHNYVRIRTRDGHEGFYGYVDWEALPMLLGPLRRLLIGQSALAVEKLWDQMYRANRHARTGHYMMAISYLDNALWDLRARFLGLPVFRLLGGPTREPVPVYGSCLGFSVEPDLAAARAVRLKQAGFKRQKWFLAYGPGDGAPGLAQNVALVRALRNAVGEDVELMFDAFMGWDLAYALAWARRVEPFAPTWIEEAFPVADLESFVRLSRGTTVPVATGEHFYNRWEVQPFLRADALQFVQADPEWCGGVSELLKICHLASVHGVKVVPHGHNVHAALHVVAAQSPAVCPYGEYLINYVPGKVHFQLNPPQTDKGLIQLPEAPGFGIKLDEAKIETIQVVTEA